MEYLERICPVVQNSKVVVVLQHVSCFVWKCCKCEWCCIVSCVLRYRCDSTEKLKSKLDGLRCLLSDPATFKNIFRFAYDFAKVSCRNLSASVFSLVFPFTDGYDLVVGLSVF